MKKLTVNADYEEVNRTPLFLKAGQEVTTGNEDSTWPNWIWVETKEDRTGYVPKSYLQETQTARAVLTQDFDGKVLKVSKGEIVESEFELGGWHWCHNNEGRQGWVPNYLFRRDLAE